MKRMVVLVLLLGACPPSREEFSERYVQAVCEFNAGCDPDGFPDIDACVERGMSTAVDPYPGCAYDQRAAQDCLAGIEDLTCPGPGDSGRFPAACDEVYDCP
jgi:hypothetical protein